MPVFTHRRVPVIIRCESPLRLFAYKNAITLTYLAIIAIIGLIAFVIRGIVS